MSFLLLLSALLLAGGDDPFDAYASVLEKNISDGRVDYGGVAKMRGELDAFLASVATTQPKRGRNAQIAFYIDAYNALVLRSVLNHGQPKSVLEVKDFFGARAHTVAGEKVSLDQLEKKILAPLAKDPRIHMVLVCAAKGCPVLEDTPYQGSRLERRLERATARYVRSSAGARVKENRLELSKIFEWYASDFGGEAGAVAFVRKRLPPKQNAALGDAPSVAYFEYDWSLNRR